MKFLGLVVFIILALSPISRGIENGKETARGAAAGILPWLGIKGGVLRNLLCSDNAVLQKYPFLSTICGTDWSSSDSVKSAGAGAGSAGSG